ncbi:GNAT family N-acetyltransferase [Cellulomonas cellasea]|uniref:GNAT family N-acetyltransferase n=1 Tax=Cellulomonas cellasea TaxID=43670 RepID=UPI0025A448B7|nr:GNAT family N-acetyltransferase [Cellulomonas cellasea]MDM8086492.1 GNAT family N-acetyltransferase [Cellulomonas cellasea]
MADEEEVAGQHAQARHGWRAREIGALLGDALADDPGFSHVLPDATARHTTLRAVYTFTARDAHRSGRVLTTQDGSGLAGVALWRPPGSAPVSVRRWLRSTPDAARVLWHARRRTPALLRLAAQIGEAVPVDAWYLQALGVRADAQRRGHGRRLVQPLLDEADAHGTPCCLETFHLSNVPYYEALGFVAPAGPMPLFPGGPAVVRMSRPPRP